MDFVSIHIFKFRAAKGGGGVPEKKTKITVKMPNIKVNIFYYRDLEEILVHSI